MTPRIVLQSCKKGFTQDLDKAISPADTIARIRKRLAAWQGDVFAGSRRVDTGRLGIPVYLGICGAEARAIMPARKQMGKGASAAQAEASAVMELMERFAFFSFFRDPAFVTRATFSAAASLFGQRRIPVSDMLRSVADDLPESQALEMLDLLQWQFYPATDLRTGENIWLPLDWFRLLGEFNGSCAGNTAEESLLQGLCELVERHVCCIADETRPVLPTIDQDGMADPVLARLCEAFRRNGIKLILKDMTLGMPAPTVAALAWDPATFPADSEIVFTAGTATSPVKAAIRAVTEVAQLGGDFCTHSCYEASGLPKFASLDECQWLLAGPVIKLDSLPNIAQEDMRDELARLISGLEPVPVYAVETTHPGLAIPAHYVMAPGLRFRERDKNQSLGLFIGRKLAEECEPEYARKGLQALARAYPDAHFLPFFEGMLVLREGRHENAARLFAAALPKQPDDDAKSLAAFYAGYAETLAEKWQAAQPWLEQALQLAPGMKEAANLLGVCHFKSGEYAQAEACFDKALAIDKGSAMDLANRGLARKFQGKKAEAAHDLEAALALDPTLAFAARHLCELEAR